MLLGITKASLTTQSFISTASFQEATRGLDRRGDLRRAGHLAGLEEGHHHRHLISAGTGIYRYHDIEIEPPEGFTFRRRCEAALPGARLVPSPFPKEVEAEPVT